MNVIFLDFNGVLDTHEIFDVIDVGNLERLRKIVMETDSKVVVSSSLKNTYYFTGHHCRLFKYLVNALESVGIEVIGFTPKGENREVEIIKYLREHPEIDNYCILDDDYDMKSLNDHLVKIPNQMSKECKGLEDKYVDLAIKILKP